MNNRRRLLSLDAIRVVAMGAVAIGHLWGGSPGSDNLVRDVVFSWNVPVFFFLTGYLWTPGRPLVAEMRSRATSLLLPYVSWLVVISAIVVMLSVVSASGGFPARLLLAAVRGGAAASGPFAAFWFLPALFLVAVLFRALERIPAPAAWALALIGLVTAWTRPDVYTHIPLDAGLAIPCLVFCLSGQSLRRLAIPGSRIVRAVVSALIGLVAVGSFAGHLVAPLDMKYGRFGTPVLSVVGAIVICAAIVVFARAFVADTAQALPVTEMATVSTVVLLTHLGLFQLLVHLHVPTAATFVLGLGISWLVAVLLHRTPASRLLVGVPPLAMHPRDRSRTGPDRVAARR